jgi:Collagen triple helix repeat (20 copies)
MGRGLGRFLRHNTIAMLALFVALGGTTYAATALPKSSVGTAQLKNGAVTKTKINKKTIAALKGNRGRTGPQGAQGPKGTTGAQGVQGVQGVQGPPGPTYWVVVSSAGAILRQSGGWTLTHSSVGRWVVDNPNLNESQMAVADGAFRGVLEGTAPTFVTTFANDTNGFHVSTYDSTGALADLGFSIIATQ